MQQKWENRSKLYFWFEILVFEISRIDLFFTVTGQLYCKYLPLFGYKMELFHIPIPPPPPPKKKSKNLALNFTGLFMKGKGGGRNPTFYSLIQ